MHKAAFSLNVVFLLVAVLMLQGCVEESNTRWTQVRGTEAYDSASYACQNDVDTKAWNRQQARQAKTTTRCSGYNLDGIVSVRCRETAPAQSNFGAFLQGWNEATFKRQDFQECMAAHGWKKQAVQQNTQRSSSAMKKVTAESERRRAEKLRITTAPVTYVDTPVRKSENTYEKYAADGSLIRGCQKQDGNMHTKLAQDGRLYVLLMSETRCASLGGMSVNW